MNKMKYESPNFDFQEMKLMEKVADKCWGLGYGWYDANHDGKHYADEVIHFTDITGADGSGKCSDIANALVGYMNAHYSLKLTIEDVKQNSDSKYIEAIGS